MQSDFEREEDLSASDWKHMYCILLRSIDAALAADTSSAACRVLRKAMEDAEEYYISAAGLEN